MAGLFSTPSTPAMQPMPTTPSLSDEVVQKAADDAAKARQRTGRASTFLTDPQSQRTAEPSAQTYLGGI